MGPVRTRLLLPLAPLTGLRWVTGVLAEEAERELAARQSPERALAELDVKRANGEIGDAEAEAREAELIEQLLSRHGLAGGT
ncbi:MAG TPA: gas vesicle protein GvpG [Solirubrobacteraceae bacterium]|nr:gas vesicle protein GvpG [Solirubrobacteraceae bacterium]